MEVSAAALAVSVIAAAFLIGTRFAVSGNLTVDEVLVLRLIPAFFIMLPLMLDLGVLVDEFCRISIVSMNATNPSSRVKDIINTLIFKELFYSNLIHKIKFLPSPGNNFVAQ